jgi:TrmH family RNA methyltransferase
VTTPAPQPPEALTNPRAERVKAVRALAQRAVRDRAGRFLVEGPQSVREAVTSGARVRDVYLTVAAAERYPGSRTRPVRGCGWPRPRCSTP